MEVGEQVDQARLVQRLRLVRKSRPGGCPAAAVPGQERGGIEIDAADGGHVLDRIEIELEIGFEIEFNL